MTKIFLEGLPGAGKTTTCKNLRIANVPIAPEFGLAQSAEDYPGDGTTVEEILAIDDWFIDVESKRMKSNRGIFDRSFLGNLTYAYAYGKLKRLDSLRPTVQKYEKALELGRLTLPQAVVYIDVSPELSIERQHKRVEQGTPLLDGFWRDKLFLQDLRDSHVSLFGACTELPLLWLDAEVEITVTTQRIADFYKSFDGNGPNTRPTLNLDHYIADLMKINDI